MKTQNCWKMCTNDSSSILSCVNKLFTALPWFSWMWGLASVINWSNFLGQFLAYFLFVSSWLQDRLYWLSLLVFLLRQSVMLALSQPDPSFALKISSLFFTKLSSTWNLMILWKVSTSLTGSLQKLNSVGTASRSKQKFSQFALAELFV